MGAVHIAIHARDGITRAALASCVERDQRLREVKSDQADVTVVAVETIDASTIDFLRGISPDSSVSFLIIAERVGHTDMSAAVACGVRAVLWRANFTPAAFVQAVLTVGDGRGVLPTSLQGTLMRQVQWVHREVLAPQGLTTSGFTDREIAVLRLLSEGMDLEEISTKLSYSERTVKNILYGVTKRFNFRNRTHAVSHAIRSGLI
jgi:DNA-binding NarL/FixJ family response regulator